MGARPSIDGKTSVKNTAMLDMAVAFDTRLLFSSSIGHGFLRIGNCQQH
jgi:hypothetical protein